MQSKTKKAFRNVLAFLTVLTMMLGMLPTTLLAANTDDSGTAGESGMHLSKTARLEDDGTYTINLEAYATGKTTTTITKEAVPLDIVLVLDQSRSMSDDMGYTYTLEDKTSYSYDDINSSARYYLDTDGNYYKVQRETNRIGSWRKYYLFYKKDGTSYYLNGDEVTTNKRECNYTGSGDTIWASQLYSRTITTKLDALKDAVSNFVGVVKEKATTDKVNHRIAMVGFASESDYGNNTEILSVDGSNSGSVGVSYNSDKYADAKQNAFQDTSTDAGNTMLNNAINALDANGATRADLGMTMAKDILDANSLGDDSKRKQLVIMFTDGKPTSWDTFDENIANDAIGTSKDLKDQGTTVYTIGVFNGADPSSTSDVNKYMNYVSTNYPSAEKLDNSGKGGNNGYYLAATSADGLNKIFTSISNTITTPSTTVALNKNAVMKDILSDDFTLPEGYNAGDKITVSTVPGSTEDGNSISWGTESKSKDIKATIDDNTINVTDFDYSNEYIAPRHNGEKLVVTIKGVIPKDSAATGEKVYTNNEASGIYAEGAPEPAAKFPRPQVVLTNKAYVLDYAKPVTLSSSDWKMSSDKMAITKSIGEKDAGYTPEYGLLDNTSLVYSPKTTNWDGYDKFYAFGKTTNNDIIKTNGNNDNLWSRVSVLPANNVYYEDDFETNKATETVGIEYTGKWSTVSSDTESANTESANTEIHGGWKNAALTDDTKYSDGSAHMADADDKGETGKAATATFTFSGTGVDIYSHTNVSAGRVSAILKSVNADGEKTVVKALIMDNKSVGDYYQIPTLSFGPLEYGKYEVKLVVAAAGRKDTTARRSTYYLDGIRVYNPIKDKETDTVVKDAYGTNMLNATFKEVRDILLDTGTAEGNLANGAVVFLDRTTVDENATSNKVAEFKDYGPKNEVYLAAGQKIAFKVTNPNASYYVGLKAPVDTTTVSFTNDTNRSSTEINHSTDLYYKITPVTAGEYEGCILIENTGNNLLSITKIYYNSTEGGIEGISDTVNTQSAASSTETVNEVTTPAEAADAFDDGSQFTDASDGDMPEAENTDLFAAEAEEVPEAEESVSVLENPLVLKLVEYANVFDTLSEVPYEDKTVEGTPDSGQDENTEVTEPDDGNVDITNPEPNEDQKPIDKIHSWLNKLFQGFNGWL